MRRVSPTRYQALAAIAAAAFVGIPTELPSRQVSVGVLGCYAITHFQGILRGSFSRKKTAIRLPRLRKQNKPAVALTAVERPHYTQTPTEDRGGGFCVKACLQQLDV